MLRLEGSLEHELPEALWESVGRVKGVATFTSCTVATAKDPGERCPGDADDREGWS